ncbi:response regulator transcription factor [Pandoraea sp. NPDC090278]|uniref:response regulator n=1 Tax=Pandoraea sp. NPDC090278 TaxID=3364391 RepID=UPI00383AD01E
MNTYFNTIIADDHPISICGINRVLSKDVFSVVGTAVTGREVLRQLSQKKVDILISDVLMPFDVAGDERPLLLFERIKVEYPDVVIIAITMSRSKALLLRLYEIGVSGIILKNEAAYLLPMICEVALKNDEREPVCSPQSKIIMFGRGM